MGLADVHAHLTHHRLAAGVEHVLERARDAGVTTVIANGLNLADNAAVLALSRSYPAVRPAFGLYPVDAVLDELRGLGRDYPREGDGAPAEAGIAWVREHVEQAIAVGEIGLDGHWVPEELWPRQDEVFRAMVRLAVDAAKPVIVHTRKRERRALEVLRELGAPRVCWHCFGGKVALARQIAAEPGHWFSIPANARRSESFTRMLQTLPRDRLLFETDCPYLSPDRERASEPADVAGTAAHTAELWGVPLAEVAERTADNFARLFGVVP